MLNVFGTTALFDSLRRPRLPVRRCRLTSLTSIACTLVLAVLVGACTEGSGQESQPVEEPLPPLAFESSVPEGLRDLIGAPFTGDLDEMEARRIIRVGVAFNRTHYFVDQGTQRGMTVAYLREFENALNTARRTRNLRIHVVIVPLPRELLLPALTEGRIDAVAAQWTITPERQQVVDFSRPIRRNVNEVVVTAPGVPPIASVDDLSGREVVVPRATSYHQSLLALNERFEAEGRSPVFIVELPESLEDDDLLEMVNAGLVEATVVDDYLAQFWSQIFTDMVVNPGAAVRSGGELAVAFRKNSPRFEEEMNAFIREHATGTLFGNIIARRYLQNTTFVRPATTGNDRATFMALKDLFQKYGDQYDLDYLLMMAKGYQESRLDQAARSPVGAIGVMQIMPATGRALNVGDIFQTEPNVHAGIKYSRQLRDEYLGNEPLDDLNRSLFALASYNAGPTRIRNLRREAERRDLDPNVWFGQVELVAAERIGRETVSYVSNIYKYYLAYRLVAEEDQRRREQRAKLRGRED